MRKGNTGSIPLCFRWRKDWRKREGIAMSARGPRPALREARLAKLPRATGERPLFLLFVGASLGSIPLCFRWGKDWRKREGIEPTGDIAASRPDLKSGGATSAPSASDRMTSAGAGEPSLRAPAGNGPTSCPTLSGGASWTFPSFSFAAGFPASVPSSSPLRRVASWEPRGHYTR